MARWRTHNRRAEKKRRMPYARFRRLRKAARLGIAYGMGAQKLVDAFEKLGATAQDAVSQLEAFKDRFGTLSGRIVHSGPVPQYRMPKSIPAILPRGELVITNYAAIELRVLALHQQQLQEARERGDTVIEHNAYDASVFVVPGVPSKIVENKP